MQHHNRTIKYIRYILSFFLVLGALFAAGQHRATAYAAGNDRIYYFNMSANGVEGSMILVETDGHWGLMDAGHTSARTITDASGRTYSITGNGLSSQIYCRNGKDVANYMINQLGVTHLDFVVGTHAHSDHVGGIPEVASAAYKDSSGKTKYLVDSKTTYYYKEYQHISDLEDDLVQYSSASWHNQAFAYQAKTSMANRGAELVDVSKAQVIHGDPGNTYGDYITFNVGNMSFRLYNVHEQTNTGNENVNSIVTVMTNGNYSVVNLADINTNNGAIDKTSQAIAKDFSSVDVLVAGHHGYAGSNTKTMFDSLRPSFVVVPNGQASSWLYTDSDLAAAIPYAQGLFDTAFYNLSISQYAVVTDLSGRQVYVYSVSGKGDLTNAINRMMKSANKTGWASWVNTNGTLWSYLENGKSVKNAWRQVDGKWYHFDKTGIMQTGWITVNGNQYCLDKDGAAVSGWVKRDNKWYYLNPNNNGFGKAVTGWNYINNDWYYFNGEGQMLANVWVTDFYLKSDGAMATGWQKLDGAWYYLEPDPATKKLGAVTKGWRYIGSNWYYFDSKGRMASNKWVDGFYLKKDGDMATGWQEVNGVWYYLEPDPATKKLGAVTKGWRYIGSNWYYFDNEGHMANNKWVDGFYLKKDGDMATGWMNLGGFRYYLEPDPATKKLGAVTKGWRYIGSNWYYFDNEGHMASNKWVDGFYLKKDGDMATGWQEVNGVWYYLEPDPATKKLGAVTTGWRYIGNCWYYFGGDGVMVTGQHRIDGKLYYFYDNGVMAANVQIGNYKYDGSGAGTEVVKTAAPKKTDNQENNQDNKSGTLMMRSMAKAPVETAVVTDQTADEVDRSGDVVNQSGDVVDQSGDAVDRSGDVVDQPGNVIDQTDVVADQTGDVVDQTGDVVDQPSDENDGEIEDEAA